MSIAEGIHVNIAEIVNHPLLILVIGAAISGLLIPKLTNRWQINQKGLDIRINLVGRISQTVMGMNTMINSMVEEKPSEKLAKEYDKEYRRFKVDCSVIWAELESYFSNEEIGRKWVNLFGMIESFYKSIKGYYKENKEDLSMLKSIADTCIERKRNQILHKKYVVMQLVLNRPMARFSPRLTIMCWDKSSANVRRSKPYHKRIDSLMGDDGTSDTEPVDLLGGSIFDVYSKGNISEKEYDSLRNKTSVLYERIFRQRIDTSLKNNHTSSDKQIISKKLHKIRNDVEKAYSQEKIIVKHWNSLNKYILDKVRKDEKN